jgi:hypothetical protein
VLADGLLCQVRSEGSRRSRSFMHLHPAKRRYAGGLFSGPYISATEIGFEQHQKIELLS